MNDKCEWTQTDEDWNSWDTGCGNSFMLSEGTPLENDFAFCPYCGKAICETEPQ